MGTWGSVWEPWEPMTGNLTVWEPRVPIGAILGTQALLNSMAAHAPEPDEEVLLASNGVDCVHCHLDVCGSLISRQGDAEDRI